MKECACLASAEQSYCLSILPQLLWQFEGVLLPGPQQGIAIPPLFWRFDPPPATHPYPLPATMWLREKLVPDSSSTQASPAPPWITPAQKQQ